MRIENAILSTAFRYFAAVARAGSIRAAARELNIASSAINRQVLMLEEAIGIALFERTGRALRLNQAGELLLAQITATGREYEDTLAAIEALKGLRSGTVRVATVESASVELLPRFLASFNAAHPGISVELQVTGSDAVTARVRAREADIGFTFNPASLEGLQVAHENAMQIGAIVSPDHPLAGHKTVSLADCLVHPYAWPAHGLSLRTALDIARQQLERAAPPLLQANSLRVMAALARQGRCVAFQTEVGIERHLQTGALKFLPLTDDVLPPDRFMLVRQAGRTPSLAAEAFFEHVIQEL
ncbi:MAG: LysR family transcriptional regulator [Rhizobiales bacterium]|nr:LysR family transcriptional regulator [Hyphomicrobiales bacterium]